MLRCSPLSCSVSDSLYQRFKQDSNNEECKLGRARILLCLVTPDLTPLEFSMSESLVRINPESKQGEVMKDTCDGGEEEEDDEAEGDPVSEDMCNVADPMDIDGYPKRDDADDTNKDGQVEFDLSALFKFLDCLPDFLSVGFEVHPLSKGGKSDENRITLRGEVRLLDISSSRTSSVKNEDYTINLYKTPKSGNELGAKIGNVKMRLFGHLARIPKTKPAKLLKSVFIQCKYTSSFLEKWNGLRRCDFICPWCHRNCRKLYNFVIHLVHEHKQQQPMDLPRTWVSESNSTETHADFEMRFILAPTPDEAKSILTSDIAKLKLNCVP